MNTQQEVDGTKSLVKEFEKRVKYFIENLIITKTARVNKVKRRVRYIDSNGKKIIYELSIPLPEELLSDFSVPEDCKHAVLSHMMLVLAHLAIDKNINDNQKENLIKIFCVYFIYTDELIENDNQLLQKESLYDDLFDVFGKLTI